MIELNKIYNMDCLEGMKLLDDNSIDSIVTDPPYELGFMGKKWDSTGIAYNVELWKECLRVLKPGGHLLAFGGTRTYHRMTCAIEDAGFEIRDCIQWLYSMGFPKSHDISKAIDKKLGAEREIIDSYTRKGRSGGIMGEKVEIERNITAPATPEAQEWEGWGTALKPANEPIVVARKPLSEKTIADNVLKWGTGGINVDGCRIPTDDNLNGGGYSKNFKGSTFLAYGGKLDYKQPAGRFPANVILDEEAGKLLDEQSGIRPAGKGNYDNEPIVVARKPLSEKTIADNVLKWGTGGINIDGCRIPTEEDLGRLNKSSATWGTYGNGASSQYGKPVEEQGRFPANVILDEEAGKLLDEQSGISISRAGGYGGKDPGMWKGKKQIERGGHNDKGGASRFFYCAKASKKERGEGNNHPTVKPVSLIKYLVTLVTPPDGVCLDPFMGSGTTAVACINTNRNYIGFELDKYYCEIANERIQKALAEKEVSE